MTTTTSDHRRDLLVVGAIGAGLTIAIGLLSPLLVDDPGVVWALYAIGAVLALVVWFGLTMSSLGGSKASGRVGPSVRQYLVGAVVTLVLGGVMVVVMDTLAAWGVGAVVAIATAGIGGFQKSE